MSVEEKLQSKIWQYGQFDALACVLENFTTTKKPSTIFERNKMRQIHGGIFVCFLTRFVFYK